MSSYDLLRAYSHAPHATLAVGETGTRTVRDFLQHVAAVAAHIPAAPDAGMGTDGSPGGDILVTCQDRYYLAVALLAAWQRKRAVALPPNGREQTLSDLAAVCPLALHDGRGPGHNIKQWLDGGGSAQPYPELPATQHVVTIYTSGSTGAPTACRKSAAQLLGEGATLQKTFQLTSSSCVLATVPPHHIYGLLFSIVLPLTAGAHFVRETPLLAPVIEELAQRFRADVLISVPAHLRVLSESELTSLAGVRRVFSSGAPLADATAQALARRFQVEVNEVLGSTETGGFAHRRADLESARFRPFAGVTISVDHEQQLCLRSPLLDPELVQPITCPDRIDLLSDGSFRHLGRNDGVIKVGGTRVSLPELETRVRELRGVNDAVAIAVDAGSARGQEIWLAIATERGQELPELRSELLKHYAPVLLPRRIRFVEALPREATGKLMRARLLELFHAAKTETMQP